MNPRCRECLEVVDVVVYDEPWLAARFECPKCGWTGWNA